jgi:NTP pyrophosphatase (non-canonical NTP hydrolase)
MLNYLKEEIKEFSEGQFGHRTDPRGPLNHLKEEVKELIDSINEVDQCNQNDSSTYEEYKKAKRNEEEEWADCLILLLDSFRIRYGNGVSFNKLLQFGLKKISIIKNREWESEPDENGIYHSKK